MDNEPYRDLSHHEARDLIPHLWSENTDGARREFKLPCGHVADVLLRSSLGEIVIVEVKLSLRDSLVQQAWEKYGRWCDRLYVAIPDLRIKRLSDVPFLLEWTERSEKVGILGVYRDSLAVVRNAQHRRMEPSCRAKITDLLATP